MASGQVRRPKCRSAAERPHLLIWGLFRSVSKYLSARQAGYSPPGSGREGKPIRLLPF